jgi:hypothetical protein
MDTDLENVLRRIERMGKRRRAAALQDAGADMLDARQSRSVVECASPLALWREADAITANWWK